MPFGQRYLDLGLDDNMTIAEYDNMAANNRHITSEILEQAIKNNDLDAMVSYSTRLTIYYAPAGFPALTVPAGYKDDGEPFGITFVGNYLEDASLIKIAYAYETQFPHRQRPLKYIENTSLKPQ